MRLDTYYYFKYLIINLNINKMRIFTKSLLAFALLLVAGGVNAQKVWQKVAAEGWVHEWQSLDGPRYDGVIQPDAEGVYKVFVCSLSDAYADGHAKDDNGNLQSWDSQFFITWGEDNSLAEGEKFKVSFKYKADNDAAGIGTQAHRAPGQYNHWECIGNFDFTSEWKEFTSDEVEVSSDMASGNDGEGFWTIAFNLALGEENYCYFKDIVVEIYTEKKTTKTVVSNKMDWRQLVVNGDCEGDDVSAFYTRTWPYTDGDPAPHSTIVDGVGVDGSRGVKVVTNDKEMENWDTQFWIKFTEEVPSGAKLKVKFDYKSENELDVNDEGNTITIPTQSHTIKPGEDSYIHYSLLGNIGFTPEWQTFENENLTISTDQSKSDKMMGSIAFNLNESNPANIYYFDNMSVEIGSRINSVTHQPDAIQILFTDWTNIPDLIKAATTKSRLILPDDVANKAIKVVADGQDIPLGTVEYDKAGQLFVFLDEDIAEAENVKVTFTNPEDEKYRIIFTNGDNINEAVADFEAESEYDDELDLVPFAFGKPDLEACDPENGSFNLPATTSEFKITFDKAVQCELIEAKLDEKEKLTVSYEKADAEEITLKRAAGAAALADGAHTITISRVYAYTDQSHTEVSSFTIKFSVGAPAMHEDLVYALDKAKAELELSEDARYAGNAFTALKEAIEKYDAEGATYTAPSVVKAAVGDLSLKTENMKTHRTNCNDYDQSLASAIQIVADYGESKFAKTELYQVLKAAVAKYEGKVLYDDDELIAAVADLKNNVAAGQQMFTEGVSNNGDAGIKVLVDRIRQGAESLQNLGASEEDELIVAANDAVTDDNDLAEKIKTRIKTIVYGKLKDGDESLFSEDIDDEGNEIKQGPDFTVFVMNPNMYALYPKDGISLENTPGWERLNGNMGLYGSGGANWGNPRNIEGLPEDCAFTIYQADTRAEQTITDLPAGNYLVTLYGCDWANKKGDDGTGPDAEGFVYVKTSDTPAVEEGAEEDRDVNFAATCTAWYPGQYRMDGAHNMEVTVTDGKLTIGMQFKSDSQYFFGDVKLTLIGAAEGFDYAKAYEELAASVEAIKQNVNYNVIFDLQGRRIANPTKGLYIKNNKKVVIK